MSPTPHFFKASSHPDETEAFLLEQRLFATQQASLFYKTGMQLALWKATQAFREGEAPIGALIVDRKAQRILSCAHNGCEKHKDPLAHAEVLAIQQACGALQQKQLHDCILFVTLEPCALCAGAILESQLSELVYGAYRIQGGAIDHGPCLLSWASYLKAPPVKVYSGLEAEASQKLLTSFFKLKRTQTS